MKNFIVGIILLVGVSLLLASCNKTFTTPAPSSSGSGGSGGSGVPSGSTTISLYTPSISAAIVQQSGLSNVASVILMTDTMVVNNATVTITGPSGFSLPLTFTSGAPSGSYYGAFYDSVPSYTYTANVTYTVTVSYNGHTYTDTVLSPGNVVFTPSGGNLIVTWAGGGNLTNISIIGPTSSQIPAVISSPYTIPASSFPGNNGTNYSITLNAEQTNIGGYAGTSYIASAFSATDQEDYQF